ncbi:hypothetical protein SDC9_190448 [bioreactor metagenome]|uniref:Uncharacterized protein n=1 Tax=bioreactor metagenome TaxID=1076179 RepID=A0A645HVL0_9ZZZZ
MFAAVQVRLHGYAPARAKKGHEQCLTSLRWHYPDQVVRVFLSLHKEGHPESLKHKRNTLVSVTGYCLCLAM